MERAADSSSATSRWHYRPYPVEENFEQWVTNRFGKRLYEIFFKTYTEKVWGIPCTRDPRRMGGAADSGAVAGAGHPQRDVAQQTIDADQEPDQRVPLPAPGSGADVGNVPRSRREMGNDVLMEHQRHARSRCGPAASWAVCAATPAGEQRFEADHVISTMPLRSLAARFDPAAPAVAARPRPKVCGIATFSSSR